ncbi:MAG: hypothetical protein KF734_01020 [Saprospiraceae bacterium]|nr:hypothetical protein [Saprospiraceae bacterium]
MNNLYDDQLLDDYLLDRLGEAERRQVEERAARDADFAAEIALRRAIIEGTERAGEQNLKEKIAALDAALEREGFFSQTQPVSRKVWVRRLSWAAAVALLLSAGLWRWLQDRPRTSDQVAVSPPSHDTQQDNIPRLADTVLPPSAQSSTDASEKRFSALVKAAYSATAPNFSGVRSAGRPSSVVEQASAAYENHDFRRALQLLDTLPTSAPNYWQAAEIRAHALFHLDEIKRATALFSEIAKSRQLPFSERAQWFLLICYGKDYSKQKNAFQTLANEIMADPEHPYFAQTQDLAAIMSGQ